MDDELERIWKEAIVTQFEVKSYDSPRGTEVNHKKYRQPG
jgi:hypothetical protein